MNSFLSSKDKWAWEFQRQHENKMCISKQTMKNRLHLLFKAATNMINWVKPDILTERRQILKAQQREDTH